MRIYLAGDIDNYLIEEMKNLKNKYLLQSFYKMRGFSKEKVSTYMKSCNHFLLDSGAFTFMNSGKEVDWKSYINDYIDFVNFFNIDSYFELDLYTLKNIGIQNTVRIRKYIEEGTGRKSIPVFHACMGISMYRQLCEEYDYIAIGASGITPECRWTKNENLLRQMLRIADEYDTKVHGLGYTSLKNINNGIVPFYSVDSTSWLSGGRFGIMYKIMNNNIFNKNCKNMYNNKQINSYNLKTWVKIQKIKDCEE